MKVKLSPDKLALAMVLTGHNWSQERIGALLGVDRSAISYAIRRRKTMLPSKLDMIQAELAGQVVARTEAVARAAVIAELRKIAAELETR